MGIQQGDRMHIVTEYLDAFKLTELVPVVDGPFPHRHSLVTLQTWMSQLFDGLAHMHRMGMVHRDLHGDNILIEKDSVGQPSQGPTTLRIIDFGAAKVHEVMSPSVMSHQAGCWQYYSPERRRGEGFDDRDDVWAAGCLFMELATGKMINKRPACGLGGIDFALRPESIAAAIQEFDDGCCRDLAQKALSLERHSRPQADALKDECNRMQKRRPASNDRHPLDGPSPCKVQRCHGSLRTQ